MKRVDGCLIVGVSYVPKQFEDFFSESDKQNDVRHCHQKENSKIDTIPIFHLINLLISFNRCFTHSALRVGMIN